MSPYPYERRSGRDRRSGADRRKLGEEMDEERSQGKAAQMRPHLGDFWNRKGKDLFRTHRYPEAKDALLNAVKIKPELADAWYAIACIESMKSEKEWALRRLRKAIELEPGYKEKARTQTYFKKLNGDADFERLVK
jgi:tetratricopeptide (TPR) repeat protein